MVKGDFSGRVQIITTFLLSIMLLQLFPIDVLAEISASLEAPTGLTAVKANTSVTLTWKKTRTNKNIVEYEVTYQNLDTGKTLREETNSSDPKWKVSKLTPGTEYSFYVKAKDGSGRFSAASKPLKVRTSGIKGATDKDSFYRLKAASSEKRFNQAKTQIKGAINQIFNKVKGKTANSSTDIKMAVGAGEGFSRVLGAAAVDFVEFSNLLNPLTNAQKGKDFSEKVVVNVQKTLGNPQKYLAQPVANVLKHPTVAVKNTLQSIGKLGGTVAGIGLFAYDSIQDEYRKYKLEKDPYNKGNMVGVAAGTLFLVTAGPKDGRKIDVLVDGYKGGQLKLGSLENGLAKMGKEVEFQPSQLKTLTFQGIQEKMAEYVHVREQIIKLDEDILKKVRNEVLTESEAGSCLKIMERALAQTDDALTTLQKEDKLIIGVRKLINADYLKETFSLEQLAFLEQDVVRHIDLLKTSDIASKGQIIENKILLGEIRITQKELSKSLNSKDKINSIDELMENRVKWYIKDYFSFIDLTQLGHEVSQELKYLSNKCAELGDLLKRSKNNPQLKMQFDDYNRANIRQNDLLSRIKVVKERQEMSLTGGNVAQELLDKNLEKTFRLDELKQMQYEVIDDIKYLKEIGASPVVVNTNRELWENLNQAVKSATIKERAFQYKISQKLNPARFLQGVKLESLSLAKLRQYNEEGENLLKFLETKQQEIWRNKDSGIINIEEAIDLLAKNYKQQDKIVGKLISLQKEMKWRKLEDN